MQLRRGFIRNIYFLFAVVIAALSLSVHDADARTQLVATIAVQSNPFGVAVNPNKNLVYVANSGSDTLSIIDATSNSVIAGVRTGSNPRGIAVDGMRDLTYVTNLGSSSVSVIDGASNTVVADVSVCGAPEGVVFDSTSNRVFVADSACDQVTVIDSNTATVLSSIKSGGSRPVALALNRKTGRLYVANLISDSVGVIDTATETLVAVVRVGTNPAAVAVDEQTDEIYVANIHDGTVSVIDGDTNVVVAVINVGVRPMFGLVVDSPSRRGYVTNNESGDVYVLDLDRKTVLEIIPLGIGLTGAAIDSSTGRLYVANFINNTVLAIGEPNRAPIANAGPDMTVEWAAEGTTLTLDGSSSTDPDGDSLSLTWTGPFLEGDGTATGLRPTVTLVSLGPSDIRLSVNDGNGGTTYDWVTIKVVDTTAPTVTLKLVPLVGEDGKPRGKSRRYIVRFSAVDNHGSAPAVVGTLQIDGRPDSIRVSSGQIVQYKLDDDDVGVRLNEEGGLKIRALSLVLHVTAMDSSGNITEAQEAFPNPDSVDGARRVGEHRIEDGHDDEGKDNRPAKKDKGRHGRHHGKSHWS